MHHREQPREGVIGVGGVERTRARQPCPSPQGVIAEAELGIVEVRERSQPVQGVVNVARRRAGLRARHRQAIRPGVISVVYRQRAAREEGVIRRRLRQPSQVVVAEAVRPRGV